MELGVLEIARYKQPAGELVRRVRCLAGRISVFRAQDKKDLLQYRKAIEGVDTEDRFSLLLDGNEFNAKDHFFIGFGGRDQSPPPSTIATFLTTNGISTTEVSHILSQYLLSSVKEDSICTALSPIVWRMIRQISCLEGTASAGLYFLHDPFFEFSEDAKEIFADKWANLAWKKKHIVIVTELSTRPECWIDNDFIARIPLEKPRQATIGFGGTSDAVQSMVSAVRAENLPRSGIDLTALSMKQSANNAKNTFLAHPKLSVVGVITLMLLLNYVFVLASSVVNPSDIQVVSQISTSSPSRDIGSSSSLGLEDAPDKKPIDSTPNSSPKLADPLSAYPSELQLAVSAAIKQPESLLLRPATATTESANYSDSEQDPFEKWYIELAANR